MASPVNQDQVSQSLMPSPSVPIQNPSFNSLMNSPADSMRMPSSKLRRHLFGEHVRYDIDDRFLEEIQPQLEVTCICKYDSGENFVVGRQIAVNLIYICYGLRNGFIRVINSTNRSKILLKDLDQRVTDMAFFAENVHLLASANIDGRVYVWKIEGRDDPKITANIVIAAKFIGEEKPVHPRVCWHCQNQEVLVVGIGNRILRLDTKRVGRGKVNSAEELLKCSVDKLIDGIQLIGKHNGEVTDLSMCKSLNTRLVSASVDGTIKIWDDCKLSQIGELRPHDGQPVNSVTFLTAPHRPDHIILITGGPLNREVKIWAPDSKEGSLVPSDTDSWHCTQTLELKSSAEPRDAFFNQVVALSHSGFFLLANGMKSAIYAVHIDYGPNPEKTCMDYIAEFTVTMPILSLTGTHDLLPNGPHIVQVYCVQTQAIQQYTLNLSQCLPPPIYDVYEKSGSRDATGTKGFIGLEMPLSSPDSAPTLSTKELFTSSAESKSITSRITNYNNSDTDISCPVSSTIPLSPKLVGKNCEFRSPSGTFEPRRHQLDGSVYEEKEQSRTVSSHASGLGIDMDQISVTGDKVDDVVTDSCDDLGESSIIPSAEAILSQFQSMQETLNQVLINQKEIQKQIPVMVAVPITKEGKRIETEIGKTMEKIHKAKSNSDAYWASTQDEFAKREMSNQACFQQLLNSASNGHKELFAATKKLLKKELAALVPDVGHLVTSIVDKAVSTGVSEAFQTGIGDKAVNQLEKTVNSKLEATVCRQIQAQFQRSGKQALQEALKSSMEASVFPAFYRACKTIFDQADATFEKGMVEHTSTAQQQVESMYSPLASALRDTFNSAQTKMNELVDDQRKLITQISNGPTGGFLEKVEAPAELIIELSRLVNEQKYEEAFMTSLKRTDLSTVSWLCSKVDLPVMLMSTPQPLSQNVLLLLLNQLACAIPSGTSQKLDWMIVVLIAIKPDHNLRPIFQEVSRILNQMISDPTAQSLSKIHTVIHLINSKIK